MSRPQISFHWFLPLLTCLALLGPASRAADQAPAAKPRNCGCECCQGKDVCCCQKDEAAPAAKPADNDPRHPLKGVVVDISAARSALRVKHEEIPGFMRAMTMEFKVDAATLAAAAKGQAITGTLVKRADGFWLEDVQSAK